MGTAKQNWKKLNLVRTPTDLRGALCTYSHSVNWIIPPDPDVERTARHAVEAITSDLFYIGPNDQEMIPSYLDSVEEHLEKLKSVGLGISYCVISEERFDMANWSNTFYLVSEQPLVFVRQDDIDAPKLHLLNACEETERTIIRCEAEGVSIFPKSQFVSEWLDDETSWCPTCWLSVSLCKDQMRLEFDKGKDQQQHVTAQDLLLLHAMVCSIKGVAREEFEKYVDSKTHDQENHAEAMKTFDEAQAAMNSEDVILQQALSEITQGESECVEFKSSFSVPMNFCESKWIDQGLNATQISQKRAEAEKEVIHSSLKTITAFINTNGGSLYIGVDDDGVVLGLAADYRHKAKGDNADGLQLYIRTILKTRIQPTPLGLLSFKLVKHAGQEFFKIQVSASKDIHHLGNDVYIRDGNETICLTGLNLTKWIQKRLEQ